MTTRSRTRRAAHGVANVVVSLIALALLVACVQQPALPPRASPPAPPAAGVAGTEVPPPSFPLAFYRDAARRGEPVFEVDPARSLVVVEVRRAGSLARLGHDHVIASHDLRGYVAPDAGRADLYVRLDRLTVDEPQLRAQAGFDTQPSAEDIAGTRRNMLESVLHADRHPWALIAVMDTADSSRPHVAITLNGVTRRIPVLATITSDAGAYDVTGALSVDQTDFGILPFSILGGALTVANRLDIRLEIHAQRIARTSSAGR
ncbi:MAG TPA: YceI family protein [Casimicrobiaceae bacterium]|nr:YceI family protein [Casimicrobiaceae bacterium]